MNPEKASLDDIVNHCWHRLAAANTTPDDPFRRAVLGTHDATGVALRTVVARSINPDKRRVICFTDRRTAKTHQLRAEPRIAWLFYDPLTMTQIRLGGTAGVLLTEAATEPFWRELPELSYRNFLTGRAPSTPTDEWTTDLKPHLIEENAAVSPDDARDARANFAVIVTTVDMIDWVQLDPHGNARNARAQFVWSAGAEETASSRTHRGGDRNAHWRGTWVVP